ncbi:unnamed protein product [Zymoseptoria tritici ST99CH_1A5]|uniref:Uncharacterized protein n=4 Tax=Zymoseptoria tritici TaxID=1047171 RepID=F9XG49_ZYMTI|nr:uncharacterized protein MYCGRDRAFT_94575 [Zymoseptoria tritici IPO323]SMQ52609.1 unnamed protein product [Zymoseptoria tritici ST99CH_3D7]SMR55431.1 unnamed protein product [Zymoseptoria tritici ST99CH_1E4]SMR57808.1 unnamed protein product [Zymoseptoria tritici ST99CH_3D1]SMY26243.1 unnamed protein product [Zymoseptoria tritici ST99CH_1A5]EGP85732.1 hypothetical protein MYCGRDRAFT_94575 [Zymoseptoria tritici IPO323]
MAPNAAQQLRDKLDGTHSLLDEIEAACNNYDAIEALHDRIDATRHELQSTRNDLEDAHDDLEAKRKDYDELREANNTLQKNFDRGMSLQRDLSKLYSGARDELARTKDLLNEALSANKELTEKIGSSAVKDQAEQIVQLRRELQLEQDESAHFKTQLQQVQDESARMKTMLKVSELLEDVRIVGTIRARSSTTPPPPPSYPSPPPPPPPISDEYSDELLTQQRESEADIKHILDEDENDILGLNDTPKLTANVKKHESPGSHTSSSTEIGIGAANLHQNKLRTVVGEESSTTQSDTRIGHVIFNPDGSETFIPMPQSLGHNREDSSQMNQENAYTQVDFNRVAGVAIFAEDVADEDKFEYWRSFANNNPRHSATSWRWYYERYVRPSFVAQQAARLSKNSAPSAEVAGEDTPSLAEIHSSVTVGCDKISLSEAALSPVSDHFSDPACLRRASRMVCVSNVPPTMTLHEVLEQLWVPDQNAVLFSANYIETSKMRFKSPCERNTVLLVFTTSKAALLCAYGMRPEHWCSKSEDFIRTQLTRVRGADTAISREIQYDINHHGATRVVGVCFETDGREEFGSEVMQAMELELSMTPIDGRRHKLPLKKSIAVSGDKYITVTFEFASLAESKVAWLKFNKLHGRPQTDAKGDLKCFYLPDPIGKTLEPDSGTIEDTLGLPAQDTEGDLSAEAHGVGFGAEDQSGSVAVKMPMTKAKGAFVQHMPVTPAHEAEDAGTNGGNEHDQELLQRRMKEAVALAMSRRPIMYAHEADKGDADESLKQGQISDKRKMKLANIAKKEAMIAENPILNELDKTVESESDDEDVQTWVTMGKLTGLIGGKGAPSKTPGPGKKGKKRRNKMNVVIETTASKERARNEDEKQAPVDTNASPGSGPVPHVPGGDETEEAINERKALEKFMAQMCLRLGSTLESVNADVQNIGHMSEATQVEEENHGKNASPDQGADNSAEHLDGSKKDGKKTMAADHVPEDDKLASELDASESQPKVPSEKEVANTLFKLCEHIDPTDILGTAQKIVIVGQKSQAFEQAMQKATKKKKQAFAVKTKA